MILPRVLELTSIDWDLAPFVRDMRWEGPPLRRDEAHRFQLSATFDTAIFHVYGRLMEDSVHVLDSFPVLQRHDDKAHGEYRTIRDNLETLDGLAEAARTGDPFSTSLTPPRAHPCVSDPAPAASLSARQPLRLRAAGARNWLGEQRIQSFWTCGG